jgi:hypothetical protein
MFNGGRLQGNAVPSRSSVMNAREQQREQTRHVGMLMTLRQI